jgi:transposase
MTIVFDKGNNSHDNVNKFVSECHYHFVGSVKPNDHKDLALISTADIRFNRLVDPRLEDVKAFRAIKEIYGKNLTAVVTFNTNLYTSQIKSINNEIHKCFDKLTELSAKLSNRSAGIVTKGKKPTEASVKAQVASILSGQHMKTLIRTSVSKMNGVPVLNFSLDSTAYSELADTYLGKNIIITDNHHWTIEDIILAYRSQYVIEDAFKQMKDRKTGSWWPMFHWTDQKIKVHGLYCTLTLLLRALLMRKVHAAGIKMSMNKLHEELDGIREVINVYVKDKKKTTQSVVSRMDEIQQRLFELFEMERYLRS